MTQRQIYTRSIRDCNILWIMSSTHPASSIMPQLWRSFRVALGYHQDTVASSTASATQLQHTRGMVDTSLANITQYTTAARDGGELTQTAASQILEAVADMHSSVETPTAERSQAMTLCLVSYEKPPRGESPPVEELEGLRRDGISHSKIAELYGVSLRTVSTWHSNSGCCKRIRQESEDIIGSRQAMQEPMGGHWCNMGPQNVGRPPPCIGVEGTNGNCEVPFAGVEPAR